jgi:hypothetical protein
MEFQAETAVRHIASAYPYDSRGTEKLSLRDNAEEISERLSAELADQVRPVGVTVIETRLTRLSYAPEIAQAMLHRPVRRVPYLAQLMRRQLAGPATMPAPAAEVACPVPECAAWRPHRQHRKARPGCAAARAGAIAISTMSGHPRPGAEAGQGRLI